MFIPVQFDSGLVCRRPATTTQTIVKGDLLKWSSGYLVVAADGDDEAEYVAMESVTTTATGQMIEVLRITDQVYFHATVDATLAQATHVGNDYDIKDKATIELGETTDKVFHIEEIISDTVAGGHFNKPALA